MEIVQAPIWIRQRRERSTPVGGARTPRVSKFAHDAALHFLARPKQYRLSDAERADLIQVVEGFTSSHDHEAARRGIEWMREHYRLLGRGTGVLITEAGNEIFGTYARNQSIFSPSPAGAQRATECLRGRRGRGRQRFCLDNGEYLKL